MLYGVTLQVYGDGLAQPRSVLLLTELPALPKAGGVSSRLSKTDLVEGLETTSPTPASRSELVLLFSKPMSAEQQVSHAVVFYRWVREESKGFEQQRQTLETAPLEAVARSWGKSLEQLQKGIPLGDLPPQVQQQVCEQIGMEQTLLWQAWVRFAPSDCRICPQYRSSDGAHGRPVGCRATFTGMVWNTLKEPLINGISSNRKDDLLGGYLYWKQRRK